MGCLLFYFLRVKNSSLSFTVFLTLMRGYFIFHLDPVKGGKSRFLKFELLADELKKTSNSVWMAFWWKQSS